MKKMLVTGGSGFFGGVLEKRLLDEGYACVNIDLERDEYSHANLVSCQGDIRDRLFLDKVFAEHSPFDTVFHCAAMLAHAVDDKQALWESNVEGTRNIAELAKKYKIGRLVFTSSNCLWAENMHRPVREDDLPNPIEIYGKSKWEAEKILLTCQDDFHVILFRCPTIIDEGRLGLLGILFEFIDEGRKVWVVGGGKNRYQFIYAQDLASACLLALNYNATDVFNIGSDNVKTFREVYEYVIDKAKTNARVASLPKTPAIAAMKLAHVLGLSPLGPYQYKMIAEDFMFDTTKIKTKLEWRPTMTNEEMLWKAYRYYHENIKDIESRNDVSAHKQVSKMGIIKLLKWMS